MNAVRFRLPGGDEIVPHEQREGQVREPTPVQVTQFADAMSKLRAAIPVTSGGHTGPRRDLSDDGVVDWTGHANPHWFPPVRKIPFGDGVGSGTISAPRTFTVSPASPGATCCTASKFTNAD